MKQLKIVLVTGKTDHRKFIMRTRVSNLNFFAQIDQQFRRKKNEF